MYSVSILSQIGKNVTTEPKTGSRLFGIDKQAGICHELTFDSLDKVEMFFRGEGDIRGVINMALLRYYGAKWALAKWITSHFPPQETYDCFVDAFGGSGAITFAAPNVPIKVWNDKSKYLWVFMKVLRERRDELIDAIMFTPYSRFELSQCQLPKDAAACDLDELEIARRFWVLSWQSRGTRSASSICDSGWRYYKKAEGSYAPNDFYAVDDVFTYANLLRGIQIECEEAEKTIERYDSSRTLFYLDPPYSYESNRSSNDYYLHDSSEHKHRDWIELVRSVRGYVILSGYDSSLYRFKLSDWECKRKDARDYAGATRTECLWLSPNISAIQLRMF